MACAIEPARTEPRHAGGRCVARGPGVKGDRPDKEATARIAWSANRPIVVTVFATSTSSPPNAGRTWAYGRSVLPCSARGEVEVGEHPFPSAWCSPRSVAWRFVPRGRLGEQRRELTSRLIVMGATLRKAGRVLEYFHGTFGVVTPLRVARLMVALSQGPVREGEVRMVSLPPRSPPPPERPPPPSSSAPPGSPPPFRRPCATIRASRPLFFRDAHRGVLRYLRFQLQPHHHLVERRLRVSFQQLRRRHQRRADELLFRPLHSHLPTS